MFTHLHGHSHYSLLNALGTPENIVKKAKELEMDSIAITDYGAMYSGIEFYEIAQKQGIKPILGVEIAIVPDKNSKQKNEPATNIVLLAENYAGYKNLLKLISIGNLEGFHERSRIDFKDFEQHCEGLIGFMGGLNSHIGKLIQNNENQQKIEEIISYYKNLLGKENFFLEIIAQDHTNLKELKKINETIQELSKKTGTPLIANNNFHYIEKDEKEAYEVLLCIKDGKQISDENREKIHGDYSIQTENEIKETLQKNGMEEQEIEEIIKNNNTIKERIDVQLPLGQILFPDYQSPQEIIDLYEQNKDSLVEDGVE